MESSRWTELVTFAGLRRAAGKDSRVRGWFASRPEPRRSASFGRLRGTRLSLRFAPRCRPGGRRSRTCAPSFPRWGTCRDGRHPGSGRTAVSLRFAPRCRPGGRRSLACAPSFPRWGTCRDGRHPGSGRTAVSLRFAQRCRPGGRRSRASAPSFPAGVRAETGVIQEVGEPRFRCASRRGADLEVGVPLRARHSFP